MSSKNHEPGIVGFDAFGDIFREISAMKDVAAKQKKHDVKRERPPIQVETRAYLPVERMREIVGSQSEELADFVESLLLDQRDILERQHAAQINQLSKIVVLFGQMQGATRQSPGRRRCKVNMRNRRFGVIVQGGERG